MWQQAGLLYFQTCLGQVERCLQESLGATLISADWRSNELCTDAADNVTVPEPGGLGEDPCPAPDQLHLTISDGEPLLTTGAGGQNLAGKASNICHVLLLPTSGMGIERQLPETAGPEVEALAVQKEPEIGVAEEKAPDASAPPQLEAALQAPQGAPMPAPRAKSARARRATPKARPKGSAQRSRRMAEQTGELVCVLDVVGTLAACMSVLCSIASRDAS